MQLAGALGDVPLELGLVRAQLRLGAAMRSAIVLKDSASSSISARAAARRARVAVAGGQASRRGGQPAHRQADADVSSTETSSSRPSTAAALVRRVCSATSAAVAACCAACTRPQARRLLQLLLDRRDERGALFEQVVPRRDRWRVVARNLKPQAHRLGEVLAHQRQPRAAGRHLQLRGVQRPAAQRSPASRRAMTAAARLPRTALMADCELGERAAREYLGTVDGHARTARGGNELVDAVEGRVARVDPLRALRSAFRQLSRRSRCDASAARAVPAVAGVTGGRGRAGEVGGYRLLERIAGAA